MAFEVFLRIFRGLLRIYEKSWKCKETHKRFENPKNVKDSWENFSNISKFYRNSWKNVDENMSRNMSRSLI